MNNQRRILELENIIYQVSSQLYTLANLLEENQPIDSYPMSLMVRGIADGCPPIDHSTFAHNLDTLDTMNIREAHNALEQ